MTAGTLNPFRTHDRTNLMYANLMYLIPNRDIVVFTYTQFQNNYNFPVKANQNTFQT